MHGNCACRLQHIFHVLKGIKLGKAAFNILSVSVKIPCKLRNLGESTYNRPLGIG